MEYTKNLRLSKPSYDDDVDIQVLNNNMDMLDEKVGNLPYLPLAGGTMNGDIKLPYNTWAGLHSTRSVSEDRLNDVVCFADTNLNGTLPSLVTRSARFVFYTPSDKAFWIDNSGAWFDNDALIRDKYTDLQDFVGYTKLSTGITMQWGFVNPTNSDGNIQHVTLKTPMPTPNYVVFTSRSNYTQNIKPDQDVPSNNATFNLTRTGFDILCARSSRGQAVFWFVIGGQE